ncbi:hypothetical protein [Paraconexibacter algicola]|uniref:Uncharacterized protein n=1 Tax=Paraconexibacter algicola TaxID=2133960 RepID=A0A2T4UKQ9_9ACTN|nr:hypothetical protein [Paraconexibacter algicola]PTL59807.1 hypothetical protein C7Y72_09165 [Paraconexibacter algicola]
MRVARLTMIAATAALLGGCGAVANEDQNSDISTSTTRTTATTPRTTTTPEGARTRRDSANDEGGQKVVGGPGSPAVTGATGADTATVPSTQQGVPAGGVAAAGTVGSSTGAALALRPFSSNSPWNTAVENAAIDRRSRQWITGAQQRLGVVEQAGRAPRRERRTINAGLFINTRRWTVPVVDEEGAVPTRVVCRQLPPYCGDGARVTSLLVPADESPLPQYDGWFTVINRSEGVAYDLWRARRGRNGNVISYQFMRKWDLNGPGFQEPNTVSARGSGLPLFAGLIQPEEIQAGRIEHALAISLPGPAQRNYVQPASSTDGVGQLSSIPEGARIKLRSSVTLASLNRRVDARCDDPAFGLTARDDGTVDRSVRRSACTPYRFPGRTNRKAAEALISALKRYGAIVVDRSRVPTLYAKLNYDWSQPLRDPQGRLLDGNGRALTQAQLNASGDVSTPLLRGNEIEGLKVSDFEVVEVRGNILKFPALNSVTAQSSQGQTRNPNGQTFTPGIP